MPRIDVTTVCASSRISREDGQRLRMEIEKHWDDPGLITVDFGNVTIASLSFLDEGLGVLALTHSLDEIRKRIRVENIKQPDRAVLNRLMASRADERTQGRASAAPADR
jgi:hypothetical protein